MSSPEITDARLVLLQKINDSDGKSSNKSNQDTNANISHNIKQ
jgi:hypothetical protein